MGCFLGGALGVPCSAEPCCALAEKEEIEHPNNSFSPCSIHDRKCLQKQQAKRINNGNKMRSSGSPHHREESRPIVSTGGAPGQEGGWQTVGLRGGGGHAMPCCELSPPSLQAQGSCQSELHRALERLAASQTRTHEDLYVIPIPNCDRNGNFHPKQVGRAGGCVAGALCGAGGCGGRWVSVGAPEAPSVVAAPWTLTEAVPPFSVTRRWMGSGASAGAWTARRG